MIHSQGKIKWFNDAKGFGFIAGDSGQDIFVHHSAIVSEGYRTLNEGDTVEYDLDASPKGLKALRVHRIEAAQPTLAWARA